MAAEKQVVRVWRGATGEADADEYVTYLERTGFEEYRTTPGNQGVLGLRRLLGGRAEFLLLSFWESMDAVRGFAGADPERAVFYPEDDRFLVERDEHVSHYAIVHNRGPGAGPGASDRGEDPGPKGSPVTRIAPQIFRKRLLVEGYFGREVGAEVIREYFDRVTGELDLKTYGPPVIHRTSGQGMEINEGFDAFVPLVESGIYIAVWLNARFLSTIVYSCAPFDDAVAVDVVREFFHLDEYEAAVF